MAITGNCKLYLLSTNPRDCWLKFLPKLLWQGGKVDIYRICGFELGLHYAFAPCAGGLRSQVEVSVDLN